MKNMEENNQNITNNPNVKNESKKEKKDSKPKKQKSSFVADHVAEFKKIVWPNKNEVVKKTATVIVTSICMGVIIFCMDTVFSQLQNLIITVLN